MHVEGHFFNFRGYTSNPHSKKGEREDGKGERGREDEGGEGGREWDPALVHLHQAPQHASAGPGCDTTVEVMHITLLPIASAAAASNFLELLFSRNSSSTRVQQH